jgi:tetratricopeptide (TPR) repeat protein
MTSPSFSDLLRRHRAVATLTQEELAERSSLSVEAISLLERGVRRVPRASTVELLARSLGLSPYDRQEFLAAARRGRVPERGRPPEPKAGIAPDPTPRFLGRDAELAELERLLEQSGRVAVHGLGGIGKTQLVLRYVQLRRAAYPEGQFWLRAAQESSLVGDLASLAWHLGLPERELPEQERQIAAVLRWLRVQRRWLLVLDNVEPATQEAVDRWLPTGLAGHVVLTSRTPMWPVRLRLEPLSLDAARHFLFQATARPDVVAADAVAEALGQLPLALAQAAAYVEVSGRDLASYARLLRTRLVDLMGEARPEDYPRPVATTWQLSFDRLEGESPAAAALLRVCSFLAADDIPLYVLQEVDEPPHELGDALADDLELDRTIAALRRYSLVDRTGDALRVHRLVQAVVRGTMEPDVQRKWLGDAIRLLEQVFSEEDLQRPERWPRCARLLPHVQFVDQLAATAVEPVEPQALGQILRRAGLYASARGEFGLARPLLERALAIREQVLGPDHPSTSQSLDDLGIVLGQHGELDSSRTLLERGLAVRERVLGPEHPATAQSLHNLATLLGQQGELGSARALQERSLAIRERVLDPGHPDIANALTGLGWLLREQGDWSAARAAHERALTIREHTLGPDHPMTATSLMNLAWLLRERGELAQARALQERALAIRERTMGPESPHTARCLQHLAMTLREHGDVAAARPLLERALAIYQQALTPDHPRTAECRRALEEMGRDPTASD